MKKLKIKLIILLVTLIIIPAGIIALFESNYSGKYYPGITINGEPVAGKTYEEILKGFKTKSDALTKNGIILVFKKENSKKEINIPMTTNGLTSDILVEYFSTGNSEKTISDAYNWGRKGNFIQRLKEQSALILGKKYSASILLHKEAMESLLSREIKYFLTTSIPAQFSLNDSNEVVIIPEKIGDNIDIQKIIAVVAEKLNNFEIQPVIFNMQPETPYPTEEKLKPFLNLAKEFYNSANLNFTYKNNKWKVNGKKLITWLTLKNDNEITIDRKKLENFLSTSVVPLINNPPQNSRFEVKNGNLVETYPGTSGDVVNTDKVIEQIEKAIPSMQQSFFTTGSFAATLTASDTKIQFNAENNTIDIPIETIEIEPEVTQKTIDQYKIKDLIGRATTNFTGGSLDRQHNIEVGVSKLTGILIAPNEEFSTVWNIGEITEDAGFVKEYVIKGDQTIKELGGGLCQLATTLFRTAVNAGLSITERVNHAYVIPYYGPGLDATIYGPHPDFRFVNDTGNYLLLQGVAKNNEVTFELYGTADGRTVKISDPILSNEKPVPANRNIISSNLAIGTAKCTTATHKGITADVTYTIGYPDGSTKERVFHSVYEPWPKVCLIGTSPGAQ